MTEIKIEKKKAVWPWLLLLLLLGIIALAWLYFFLNEDGENHLIIPIGMVTLDEDNKKVHTDQIDYTTFAKTKRFKKGVDIEKSYELRVLPHYFPGNHFHEESGSDNHFYNCKEFKRPSLGATL